MNRKHNSLKYELRKQRTGASDQNPTQTQGDGAHPDCRAPYNGPPPRKTSDTPY